MEFREGSGTRPPAKLFVLHQSLNQKQASMASSTTNGEAQEGNSNLLFKPCYGKARNWVVTINNPTKDRVKFDARTMTALTQCRQIGELGTPHDQVGVQWIKDRDWTGCGAGIGQPCWRSIARGSVQSIIDYIVLDEKKTNVGIPMTQGVWDHSVVPGPSKQGIDGRLAEIKDAIFERKAKRCDILDQFPSLASRHMNVVDNWFRMERMRHTVDVTYPKNLFGYKIGMPDPKMKKRHLYIRGRPDLGKTYYTEMVFDKQRVFYVGSESKYNLEDYDDEDILVYDDVMPSLKEILDITNTYRGNRQRSGGKRYSTGYWMKDHCRTVIILHNDWPSAELQVPQFFARFNILQLGVDSEGVFGNTIVAEAKIPAQEEVIVRQHQDLSLVPDDVLEQMLDQLDMETAVAETKKEIALATHALSPTR
nr:MAG: replication associated protein [Cressdnaviricota sp.]